MWAIMLFGGATFSLYQDWQHPLFRSFYLHIFSFLVGTLVTTLAFRAAANGGKELTKGRVGDIPRLETNKLVTTGIYSCMRHPMLFGLTLLPLGWALLLGSPTFITIIAPIEMIFIVLMVLIFEEMEVKRKYKDDYKKYKTKTPMVNFSFTCLKQLFK